MTSAPADFHPAAELELEAAAEWYAQRNKAAPILFLNDIDRAINLIPQSRIAGPLDHMEPAVFFCITSLTSLSIADCFTA